MAKSGSKSATAVVTRENENQVLLHQREDFRLWALPGGGLEVDETPEQAAVRETLEETGYQIEVVRYAGQYHRPQMNDIRFVYLGRVVGGEAIERGPETWQVGWFPIDALPTPLSPSVDEIIRDALSETSPFSKETWYPNWQVWLGKTMIRLRNIRNWLLRRP